MNSYPEKVMNLFAAHLQRRIAVSYRDVNAVEAVMP